MTLVPAEQSLDDVESFRARAAELEITLGRRIAGIAQARISSRTWSAA